MRHHQPHVYSVPVTANTRPPANIPLVVAAVLVEIDLEHFPEVVYRCGEEVDGYPLCDLDEAWVLHLGLGLGAGEGLRMLQEGLVNQLAEPTIGE